MEARQVLTDLLGLLQEEVRILIIAVVSGNYWDACVFHNLLGLTEDTEYA